ncbi:hypothetical protein CSA80_03810 [Candidatus Saccharibacteria bacterium]|nr:MAG: hypothetical protein CSA80_03810 [Candidatus Saccharibacteria bacterium]
MNTKTRQKAGVSRVSIDGFIGARKDYACQYYYKDVPGVSEQSLPQSQPEAIGRTSVPGPPSPPVPTADRGSSGQLHFDLPAYTAPKRPRAVVRKKRLWRQRFVRFSAVATSCVLLVGGVLFWRGYISIQKVFQGTHTVAALSGDKVPPELLEGEGDGRVNVLLLGVGGQNHDGGDLTDTIMVLSVDPVNNKAAMLSIPRDLWVKMPVNYFGAYQKINAAYSSGKYKYLGKSDLANTNQAAVEAGFASISKAVSMVLGIRINYHVVVDFQAFSQAVDTVNGVTLDVKEQLYDPTMAWENANNPVLAPVGVQTMDGKRALMYARSRKTSSDFDRSERQRQLLFALKQKVISLDTLSSPAKIDSLLRTFRENVRTDLTTKAATRLATIMRSIDDDDIASLSLTAPDSLVTTDRVGNISVVRPRAGFDMYSDIQAYVRSQLQDGYLVKEKANVYVVAATEQARLATVETLSGYGYAVSGSVAGQELPAGTNIVDLTSGAKPYTLHYLQDRYGSAATRSLPSGVDVPDGVQFVILVGI